MAWKPIVFIHGNDPTSRTKARQHVSRVIRQREREGRIRQTETAQLGIQNENEPEAQQVEATQSHDHSADIRLSEPSRNSLVSALQRQVNTNLTPTGRPKIPGTLSGAPKDPFGTLVIQLSPVAVELLHHYNTGMPSVEFDVDESSPFIPCRQLALRSAMETPGAFHTIIAIGGVHKSALKGRAEPLLVAHHLSEALRFLRESLTRVNEKNWTTLVQPLIELCACDELRGQYRNLALHLNGIRMLLNQFGGLVKLDQVPCVQILLCYILHGAGVSYFHPDHQSHDWTLGEQSDYAIRRLTPALVGEVREHCQRLSHFMAEVTTMATSISPIFMLVRKYFHKSTKVAQLLCISDKHENNFIPGDGFGKKGFHRVALLMLIAWDVLDLFRRGDRLAVVLYLEKLHLLYHPNMRLYKFYLMQGGTAVQFTNFEKHEAVCQMMQVYKLFDMSWREKTVNALVTLLQKPPANQESVAEDLTSAANGWSLSAIMDNALPSLVFGESMDINQKPRSKSLRRWANE